MKVRIVVIRYVVLAVFLPLLGSAFGSIGPKKISIDRVDYSTVLAESWKKQMLLNIVKVRYLDLPIFLFTLAGNYGSEGLPIITIPTF